MCYINKHRPYYNRPVFFSPRGWIQPLPSNTRSLFTNSCNRAPAVPNFRRRRTCFLFRCMRPAWCPRRTSLPKPLGVSPRVFFIWRKQPFFGIQHRFGEDDVFFFVFSGWGGEEKICQAWLNKSKNRSCINNDKWWSENSDLTIFDMCDIIFPW